MTELQWEKDSLLPEAKQRPVRRGGRWKFLVAGLVILGVIAYLIWRGFGQQYSVTVDKLLSDPDMIDKSVQVSGAVVDYPTFDSETKELRFVIAHIPKDNDELKAMGGLEEALRIAAHDENANRLQVVAYNMEPPDMLRPEAEAILVGKLHQDGVFHAEEIKLKCPSKYEEAPK